MEKKVLALACLVLTFALCAWSQRAPSRSRSSGSSSTIRSVPRAPAVRSGGGFRFRPLRGLPQQEQTRCQWTRSKPAL